MRDKDDETSRGNNSDADGSMLERGFDRWLNRQLHRLYDPVLAEDVPDEIMRLLDQFEPRLDQADEQAKKSRDRKD
jgi:hypothetical protein